jgi:predicted acetyltransferase
MTLEIRPITNDEFLDYSASLMRAFGETPNAEHAEHHRPVAELDRTLAAFDGGRIVATYGIETYELTVPGGSTVPAAGVTAVSVAPTHHRRGIMSTMMRRGLDDAHRRGEPVAILLSSESLIYGRYGFGIATQEAQYEIQKGHTGFTKHPEITGTVDVLGMKEAGDVLPPLFDRVRQSHPGFLTRNGPWWELWLKDLEHWRDGYSDRRVAVYTAGNGTVDGYGAFRTKSSWDGGFPNNTLRITDFITRTSEARAGIFQFCGDVDLVTKIEIQSAPLDDPLRWMLADPRRLAVKSTNDFLWVRPNDVSSALAARRYAIEGKLVLEIEDPFRPESSGRYVLEGGPDGAACKRSRSKPDLAMSAADLGAAYLGGVTFSTLARAGRVQECVAGTLRRGDLMFSSDRAPWTDHGF